MSKSHRHYMTIQPTPNKLLQKRWDEATYNKHIEKLKSIKPVIDTAPPETFMHLHLKLKKMQLEAERLSIVERDNRLLLNKMTQIMKTSGQVDNKNNIKYKSLNREKRIKNYVKIAQENKQILGRIVSRKPLYSCEKWDSEWLENCKFMDNIARFQKDWWKIENDKRASKDAKKETTQND